MTKGKNKLTKTTTTTHIHTHTHTKQMVLCCQATLKKDERNHRALFMSCKN